MSSKPFSPLFIGESSSTKESKNKEKEFKNFQSPLHRGVLFNGYNPGRFCSVPIFQSPLHRGVLFNSYHYSPSWSMILFQSPLHRGVLFNTIVPCRAILLRNFQSPLHRGVLFNGWIKVGDGWPAILSVPSSSGSPLQPRRRSRTLPIPSLSVPSSSGSPLQRPNRSKGLHSTLSFSPLFIGESSSTQFNRARWLAYIAFQSPLHRGVLFNMILVGVAFREFILSVPSSSGSPLQPTRSWTYWRKGICLSVPSSSGSPLQHGTYQKVPTKIVAFSPLFIGESSSTWKKRRRPAII